MVVYIEKNPHVTPGFVVLFVCFFFFIFIVVYSLFFLVFSFHGRGREYTCKHRFYILLVEGIFACMSPLLARVGWKPQLLFYWDADVEEAALGHMLTWLYLHKESSMSRYSESVLWPRVLSVWTLPAVKLKEKLNSGHGWATGTGIWCWNNTEYNSKLIFRKLRAPATFQKKLRRAL